MRAAWLVAAAITAASPALADATRLYSYDPADAETKTAAGPLTFEFHQGLFRLTMVSVRATEAQATANLKPAGERDLGPGGLTPLIGARAPERDLYEVRPDQEGAALIAALCPGATRAWMAFGRPRLNRDLRVYVLGAEDGPARLCRKLSFAFHGAWRMPGGRRDALLPPPYSPVPRF